MNQINPTIETIVVIIAVLMVLIIVVMLDRNQFKKFKAINTKIAENPGYLADPEKRALCATLLSQTRYVGVFSIFEARKLKKSLDAFRS